VAGRLVLLAVSSDRTLSELTLEEMRAESEAFDEDIYAALDMETAVERRNLVGGPARAQVQSQVDGLRVRLEARGNDVAGVAHSFGAVVD
jgi:argininosuccinate lyase